MPKPLACVICDRHLGEIRDGTVSKFLNEICTPCLENVNLVLGAAMQSGPYNTNTTKTVQGAFSEDFLRDFFDMPRR
jgi:hypothetical protein